MRDQPRHARWVRASHGTDALEAGLDVFIQGLGKLDAQLVYEDNAFLALPVESRAEFEESLKLTDRMTLSRLWVLGAYEVIRTVAQRVRDKPGVLSGNLATRVKSTKKDFERLRIPLAKFEPAQAHTETDFASPRPGLHKDHGISWLVAKGVFISRRQLSDLLLALLEDIDEQQTER